MTPWLRSASWGPRSHARRQGPLRVEVDALDLFLIAIMAAALVALAATL